MEGLLGFVGFGLGASLGVSATRGFGQGLRPLVRGMLKVGIRVREATASASAAVGEEIAAADEEPARAPRTRSGRRRAGPQKIAIARS
jgi:hypothetical protein